MLEINLSYISESTRGIFWSELIGKPLKCVSKEFTRNFSRNWTTKSFSSSSKYSTTNNVFQRFFLRNSSSYAFRAWSWNSSRDSSTMSCRDSTRNAYSDSSAKNSTDFHRNSSRDYVSKSSSRNLEILSRVAQQFLKEISH